MNASLRPVNKSIILFNTDELPKFKMHEWNTTSSQIAAYLRHVLERYQVSDHIESLELPSILDLSIHFGCCEMDLFDALFELKKQAYRYEINGIDHPIRITDPLLRKPSNYKRWKVLSNTIFKPIEHMRFGTENPLEPTSQPEKY
jgi:hypothetical protein